VFADSLKFAFLEKENYTPTLIVTTIGRKAITGALYQIFKLSCWANHLQSENVDLVA
jgi:hypothetical protein